MAGMGATTFSIMSLSIMALGINIMNIKRFLAKTVLII
jgi:hypothetical protein